MAFNCERTSLRSTLLILCAILFNFKVNAQCATEADLENAGVDVTIPTDGSCDPADVGLVCNQNATLWDLAGNLTVLSCATVNFTSTDNVVILGNITIEEGATVTSDRTLRIRSGATVTVNGTFTVGDGAGNDNIRVTQGASIVVGSNGSLSLTNGNLRLGNTAGTAAGTLNSSGQVSVSGDVDINGAGTLTGSGQITYGGTLTNGGTVSGDFSGCTNGSSATSCGNTSLPVELISFRHKVVDQGIELLWSTANEINNLGFEIQRSHDGLHFETIDFVEGHGTTEETKYYNYYDVEGKANSYYQMRQIDYDGAYEFSPIIYVPGDGLSAQDKITFYPNPSSSYIQIQEPVPEGIFQFQVFDQCGKLILSEENATIRMAETALSRVFSNWESGIYIAKFTGDNSFISRIIKR